MGVEVTRPTVGGGVKVAGEREDCGLRIADCGLRIEELRLEGGRNGRDRTDGTNRMEGRLET
jgi:hypothetical protein